MRRRAALALSALLSCAPVLAPASANDTSVTMGMGGLEVAKNAAIEMVSEDLFVSMDKVRVRYVFRNVTEQDVTSLVAFPLPDMRADLQESPVDIPNPASPNFVDFKTSVDGVSVPLEVENKVLLKGADRTEDVKASGAPLNPLTLNFSEQVGKLPPEARAKLKAAGLIDEDQMDQGQGFEPYWRPQWDLQTKFYRRQTFPAGRRVVVEHEYKPVIGGTVAVILNSPYTDAETKAGYKRDYCVNSRFRRAIRNLPQESQERWLTYVLKTGANWAGPIKDFTLTVDKGKPQNFVSFCGWGVTKVSKTRFQMRLKNFTPAADLNFLFVIPHPQSE